MAEPKELKSYFDAELVRRIAASFEAVCDFDSEAFVVAVMAKLEPLAMKARVHLIAEEMRHFLPGSFVAQVDLIVAVVDADSQGWRGLHAWPFLAFVRENGVQDFKESMRALNRLTRVFSAEFAIRPFLVAQQERTLEQLQIWALDPDEHVRRLVSEGTRPRLPWGMRLSAFVDEPGHTLPLLEQLKDDPSEYVRRSVANHLNDIAKDHPERVVELTQDWMNGASDERRRLIRHALRSLVKDGHGGALNVLGFRSDLDVKLCDLEVSHRVKFGESLVFAFDLVSQESAPQEVVVDYVVHHVKKNGSRRPKVFKLRTFRLRPGVVGLRKSHKIRPISTRTYYPGDHLLEIVLNGRVMASAEFLLET